MNSRFNFSLSGPTVHPEVAAGAFWERRLPAAVGRQDAAPPDFATASGWTAEPSLRFWRAGVLPALAVLSTALLPAPSGHAAEAAAPEWRGEAPGTAYLGPDILWRPRESLFFHMLDREGDGFRLTFTVRDMNTYMQGPRPVVFWVTGPSGETLAYHRLEDDGMISGNDRYRDGMYDVFQDARYRQWHARRNNSIPPAGKKRSPFLDRPRDLPFRTVEIDVPAGGEGLYRAGVFTSWDHWVSITPDRPIATGVHPGHNIVSPTDMFFLLPFHTHRTALPRELAERLEFGPLWREATSETCNGRPSPPRRSSALATTSSFSSTRHRITVSTTEDTPLPIGALSPRRVWKMVPAN